MVVEGATAARGLIIRADAGVSARAAAAAAGVVADIVGVGTGSVTAATIGPASIGIGRSATVDIRETVGQTSVEGQVPLVNVSDGAVGGVVGAAVVDVFKAVHCG
ncbi:Hypothetical predicted protein [Octopus vulgaris]|uniref:Uncharacterized protein n=1 Tax=Octopus vulgaris TaxID=6645 RepID=A0AA36AYQ2_OCTVU|nr:Hypothetical predicted protein [Octopus vulgaris]